MDLDNNQNNQPVADQAEQPAPPAAPPSHMDNKAPRLNLKQLGLIIGGIALVVLAAWLVVFQTNLFGKKVDKQPYAHTYSKLDAYKVTGLSANTGITFKKPAEFIAGIGSTYSSSELANSAAADLGLYISGKSTAVPRVLLGTESALAHPESITPFNTYAQYVTDVLSKPTSNDYKLFTKPVYEFAGNASSRFTVTIGPAHSFSNPNLKANAWQFDVSIIDKKAAIAKEYTKAYAYQGKVIYAISPKAAYYFFVLDLDYNWLHNQSSWQQVLDSIQIDQ